MEGKNIIVMGAGPGLGEHIAEEFARHGFHSILMARSRERLSRSVKTLREKGLAVDYEIVDCASNESIRAALRTAQEKYGATEVLVYNTAVLRDGLATGIDPEELARRYQVDVAGAVCAVQEVLPAMRAQGSGALLFTGGGLALRPVSQFTSISLHKAALRALAQALHDELAEQGIFAGIVNIKGGIGSDPYYAPEQIAKIFYWLYETRRETEVTY